MPTGRPSPAPIRRCNVTGGLPPLRGEAIRPRALIPKIFRSNLHACTAAVHPDRNFKYWLVAPAIFLLLLIGLFPLIYSLVVSFMRIDMMDTDTSFAGLYNYANLFKDARLWWSLAHTLLITVIALPIELILGLAMAYLFLERMPGRQIFVALLVLPTIISPIVAGATWRLLFDNRYGPINQIVSWFAGERMDASVDHQSHSRLSGHHLLRDLAVDALHVPDPAGRAVQRRQVADLRRPRSTAPASGAPSARSCCRRSGRSWRSPS